MSNPAPRRHLPLLDSSREPGVDETAIRGNYATFRFAAVGTVSTILAWALLAALSQYVLSRWFEFRFHSSAQALEAWLKTSSFFDRIGYYLLVIVLPATAFVLSVALGGAAVARVHEKSKWSDAGLGGLAAVVLAWVLTSLRLGMGASVLVLLLGGLFGFVAAVAGYRIGVHRTVS